MEHYRYYVAAAFIVAAILLTGLAMASIYLLKKAEYTLEALKENDDEA